jgi:hypothetical protein
LLRLLLSTVEGIWRGWNAPNPIIGDKSNLVAVAEELLPQSTLPKSASASCGSNDSH